MINILLINGSTIKNVTSILMHGRYADIEINYNEKRTLDCFDIVEMH